MSFRLETIALGTDDNGNVTAAPVVVQAKVTPDDGSNLKGNAVKALDSLRAVIFRALSAAKISGNSFTIDSTSANM